MRQRILILDFDFFSNVGGGQVFYRRVVERNPGADFYYPSSGADLNRRKCSQLPFNAFPFAYDARLDTPDCSATDHWLDTHYSRQISGIAAAVQGMTFHAVDIPSFLPVTHLARPALAAFGVTVELFALGLLGWQTVSVRSGYTEAKPDTLIALEKAERQALESSDVRYTISSLQHQENSDSVLPIALIDMEDAIESFPPLDSEPPDEGPPDLWYVGRLDGAKGPDLFIELVSRMPRESYGGCYFSGPDNTWSQTNRWSEYLLDLARSKGITASYEGVLTDADIRRRVYRGRTVLVVSSRTDAFNYVALEAVLNGCPLLLSERAGALGFLQTKYPHLAPAAMHPDSLEAAAGALLNLLRNYQQVARQRRKALLDEPFPPPREGFMKSIYGGTPMLSPEARESVAAMTTAMREQIPLASPAAVDWRHRGGSKSQPRVTVVISTLDRPAVLAPALACLTRQQLQEIEVIVVDNGSKDATTVRAVAEAFAPLVRCLRVGPQGEAEGLNRGFLAAKGEYVSFLPDDGAYAPELLAEAVAILDKRPNAIGAYPDWNIIDVSGYFVEARHTHDFDRSLMLSAHWCLPGPGVVIRRSVLHAIGGRDVSFRFVSDFDLWLRATALGPLIHLPHKLAWTRLHASQGTGSETRTQNAEEHIRLIEKFYSDPAEMDRSGTLRHTAIAAANLTAAAILGKAEAGQAVHHLREAERLDRDLLRNLPPNMAGYPELWPIYQ